jgi:hypothetical protein
VLTIERLSTLLVQRIYGAYNRHCNRFGIDLSLEACTDAISYRGPQCCCAGSQDLAAGTIAGTAQLLVGHPFDTIKVSWLDDKSCSWVLSFSNDPVWQQQVKIQSQSSTPGTATFRGPLDAAKQVGVCAMAPSALHWLTERS